MDLVIQKFVIFPVFTNFHNRQRLCDPIVSRFRSASQTIFARLHLGYKIASGLRWILTTIKDLGLRPLLSSHLERQLRQQSQLRHGFTAGCKCNPEKVAFPYGTDAWRLVTPCTALFFLLLRKNVEGHSCEGGVAKL